MFSPPLEASLAELAQRHAEVAALNRLAYAAGTAPDLQTLFRNGGDEVVHAFGADSMGIYLLDTTNGTLTSVYHQGVRYEHAEQHLRIPLRASLAHVVAQDGVARCWQLEDYPEPARSVLRQTGYVTVASAPMQSRSRIIGCLNISYRRPSTLTPVQLQLLSAMAAHFAAAIEAQTLLSQQRAVSEENAKLYEELRSSAAELQRAQAQLVHRDALAALGQMAAVLAHEIRNPLGVLSNGLSFLRQDNASPAQRHELLEVMGQEVERMNRLVVDLLDFARPPAATLQLEPLDALLEEVARAAKAQAGSAHVDVTIELPTDLPEVPMDARLMRQALLNVAVNGIEALRPRGRLTLRARRAEDGLLLEVEDTGPGISPAVRGRIFEPFFTTKSTGTGLGLALVKHIVEQHHGRIQVESAPGQGTRFRITLPLRPCPAPAGTPPPA